MIGSQTLRFTRTNSGTASWTAPGSIAAGASGTTNEVSSGNGYNYQGKNVGSYGVTVTGLADGTVDITDLNMLLANYDSVYSITM